MPDLKHSSTFFPIDSLYIIGQNSFPFTQQRIQVFLLAITHIIFQLACQIFQPASEYRNWWSRSMHLGGRALNDLTPAMEC
jgi:hypothetical protein